MTLTPDELREHLTRSSAKAGLSFPALTLPEAHDVLLRRMRFHYLDWGTRGRPPIVFLHGNPASSYLWRNVIPHVAGLGRCLAPDLIGMGQSGRSGDGAYTFAEHARYLDAWFEALELTRDVILVIHDWGSALGFHRAARYPDQIVGIAHMEAVTRPAKRSEFGQSGGFFQAVRSPAGEQMILDQNLFVERVLPRVPARRWGAPEDFGGIAVYLASDASRYHTGDTFVVDGGYSVF